MPIVQIDGIGRIELGVDFVQKSHQEQNAIIQDIVSQVGAKKPSVSKEPAAPDTSFTSAFASGIDAPLENLGVTAEALGFDKTGKFLRNLTSAPRNYENATDNFLNKGHEGFNWESLPRAAVEQGGQLLGALATRAAGSAAGGAIGSAVPGVGNVAGAAAGAFAGPALFGALQTVGPVAMERAQHNGRDAPNTEDWQAAIMVAGASGALDAYGIGKFFKGGGIVTNTAREGVANAAQSVVQQVGSTAGTEDGTAVDLKEAAGQGIVGGASAGGMQAGASTARAVASAPGRAIRGAQVASQVADIADFHATNPEQVASELRVQQLYEGRRGTVDQYGNRVDQQPDSVFFKSVSDDLKGQLTQIADSLFPSSHHAPDERNRIIKDAISEAARHNREPGVDGRDAGYFDTALDRVSNLEMPDADKATLLNTLRDLNTATSQNKQKNMRGPYEMQGAQLGRIAAGFAAGAAPFTGGSTLIGLAGPAIGKYAGRGLDNLLGTKTVDILRTAEARRRYADKAGLQPGNTVDDVRALRDRTQTVARQREDTRARHLEDFRQTQAELIARNEVPAGGIYKAIYDNMGLKPLEVNRGLETLVQRGEVDPETVNLFHTDPRALMDGNRGLALQNRLQKLVAEGVLQREQPAAPGPVPGSNPAPGVGNPQAAPGAPQAAPTAAPHIRNPQAYQANIDAALATHGAIQANPSLSDPVKAAGAEIAQAKTKGDKLTILQQFISTLPPAEQQAASVVLMPLTGYGAKDGPFSGVLKAPQRAPISGATPVPAAPQAAPTGQPAAPAAGPAPYPTEPRAIRIRGSKVIVSAESFERIKADPKQRKILKATGFTEVETRDGSKSLKL